MNKPERSHEELTRYALDLIRSVGVEALGHYGKGRTGVRFDEELITQNDIRLVEMFRQRLKSAYPDHQIFDRDGRIEGYSHRADRFVWVFDVLDGGANFQAGIPIWGLSLALIDNYWPVFGAFYMPATGDLFFARAGDQAFHNDMPIHIGKTANATTGEINDESVLLTFSRFHSRYHVRFPGKIRNLGCTAAHICYVAMGRADAAVVANESYQDLAAARIIVEAAGGAIYTMNGERVHLNEHIEGEKIGEDLLVTPPALRDPILQDIQPV